MTDTPKYRLSGDILVGKWPRREWVCSLPETVNTEVRPHGRGDYGLSRSAECALLFPTRSTAEWHASRCRNLFVAHQVRIEEVEA